MITVESIVQTCQAWPAQWEGRTTDGRFVYVRYRWGWLQVGFGATLEEAYDDETIDVQLGGDVDGVLSYEQLIAATQGQVEWPPRTPGEAIDAASARLTAWFDDKIQKINER